LDADFATLPSLCLARCEHQTTSDFSRRTGALLRVTITVVMFNMALARSKLTAQGQISVPVEIRKRLGIGPGAVIEWDEANGQVVVRRAGRYSSEDVHRALFDRRPTPRTLDQMKEGIRRHLRGRNARR
jgi:AbrB family looped-hinge helix DNA binding protein